MQYLALIFLFIFACRTEVVKDESFHYGYPGGYIPDVADTGEAPDTGSDDSGTAEDSDSDEPIDTGPTDSGEDSGTVDNDGDGVTDATDCDDRNSTVYPGADEDPSGTGYGDGIDNDCDGIIDEGTYLFDDDGDSYTEAEGDCDDANVDMNPGEFEIDDDGIDNDCSGTTDDPSACCPDEDGDGYGATEGCTEVGDDYTCPEGYVLVGVDFDCDDTNYTVNPGRSDSSYDGSDADCDGRED